MTRTPKARKMVKRTFMQFKFTGIDFRDPRDADNRQWFVHPNANGIWN